MRFADSAAEAVDAAAAHTAGSFSKWNANLSRLQGLGARTSLYASLVAQWANGNRDSLEKMSVGGPYSVRAYDTGTLSTDTGASGSLELRRDLGQLGSG